VVEGDASREGGVAVGSAVAVAGRSRVGLLSAGSHSLVVRVGARSIAGGLAGRRGRRRTGCSPSHEAFGFGIGTSLACSWRRKLGVGSLDSWRMSGRRFDIEAWLEGWRSGCTWAAEDLRKILEVAEVEVGARE